MCDGLTDEGMEQAVGDAVEAQVHVPADPVPVAARSACLRAVHEGTLPALPRPVPRTTGHQDEGNLFFLYSLLLIMSDGWRDHSSVGSVYGREFIHVNPPANEFKVSVKETLW